MHEQPNYQNRFKFHWFILSVGLPCSPGSPIRVGRIRKFVLPEFSDVFSILPNVLVCLNQATQKRSRHLLLLCKAGHGPLFFGVGFPSQTIFFSVPLSVQKNFPVTSSCRQFCSCLQTIYLGFFAIANNFFSGFFSPPFPKALWPTPKATKS